MKNTHWILIVLVMFTFYGCSSNVSEKSITKKLDSEIVQDQNLMDKEVQKEKVELQEPKIQEANKLNLTKDTNYNIYFEKFAVKTKIQILIYL